MKNLDVGLSTAFALLGKATDYLPDCVTASSRGATLRTDAITRRKDVGRIGECALTRSVVPCTHARRKRSSCHADERWFAVGSQAVSRKAVLSVPGLGSAAGCQSRVGGWRWHRERGPHWCWTG